MQPESPDRRRTNRLAHESSPYLLQHAHNPVDWYPWGKEAFEEARRRDVPIFLSVGYSTCYWCHVMERESFESETIAAQMNREFVCIKVDREERPDVDDIYMTAVQALTGSGGWPMNVFLEPRTLRPFWGGTYFPPEPKFGRPGFPQIMESIAEAWRTQRADVLKQADEVAEVVRQRIAARRAPVHVGERQVSQAIGSLLKLHDRLHGGFGSAPKFPQPVYLELLLRFRGHAGDEETAEAVDAAIRHTLDRMAIGGMFDQSGGGFHRYSTDERWLVPHFEKMLYDNAQLAAVYARASRAFRDEFYVRVARRTVEYVMREMSSPADGFFSAQDAEVNHREGQNYLWTVEEMQRVLGEEEGRWAAKVYGLDSGPNFRDPHHPDEPPSNILFLAERPEGVARRVGMEPAEFLARLDRVNARLLEARAKRDQPGTDDKVLCGWNGLMIGAMALAGSTLERPEYIARAEHAAEFVLREMKDDSGLLRSWRKVGERAEAKIPAFLEDYAFLIHGLLELHRAGRDARGRYLEEAIRLTDEAEARFGDPEPGGYFDTLADQEDLFVRSRSEYDGAVPCGASVMLNNLVDLAEIVGGEQGRRYQERAASCLASVSAFVSATPVGAANSTRALLRLLAADGGPAALAAVLPPPGEKVAPAEEHADPVGIFASVSKVEIGENQPGGLVLQVRVAPGYHVNAADPGPGGEDLIGLRVKVINGTGVTAYADYPRGEEYRPKWAEGAEEIRVYTGTVSIPVALERSGAWTGRPILAVTYQTCTDTACLAPRTVEIDVAIDRK